MLKPNSDRKPTSRPKSTAVGVESNCTVLELLFKVMLLIVILKATTDDTGASSAVVKICAWVFCGVDDGGELTPLQPAKMMASANSGESNTYFFMEAPVIRFLGELQTLVHI